MRQIRNGVFETNSSSTHSICISKKPVSCWGFIRFRIGEYGWENACVSDTASYLYTAILYAYSREEAEEKIEKIKQVLDKNSVSYAFEEPTYETGRWGTYIKYGYIDHGNECTEFVEAVLNDEEMLLRYLFGDSFIYTGNDNQDNEPAGCDIAFETYYDYGSDEEKPNPYHDPENYDYFYKGN